MEKEQYLGVYVSTLTYDDILADIEKRMEAGQKSTIIAVNPEKVIAAGKNDELKQLINTATYQIPDGIGVVLASKLKGGHLASRVTGIDLMERLIARAAEKGYRVFLYGAKEEVVKKAKENLEAKYPRLCIAGYMNGYVNDDEAVVQAINEANADILFVALGSPRQELWIRAHMDRLNVKVFQGVGGSFDVFAGHVKRAPKLFRTLGLEWLYRLVTDPKRFKRQLALPKFLWKVLTEKRTAGESGC
ncbi:MULTISPECIES: WecB/TagA/CpsF family glycosyltransferase [Geobacillus]|jgi:N-acetylglucosaminyldiphosphoundecaprenol N-acetyl-beta-D-mannosaminyltransferase|uniref:N-acetylglucosaminyldiphosphoundecaprenol N-acetyl-beta-D-mannosaminyltransferase n=1 Tax=Geobacillus thermodenitrificans (strain NG80-2) TaxID=420246 RepID=A4ISY5_GEOTN|nr:MULTISPECIES: WecB/TagA/CpsF family glycosyltransferase [Geobacillus]ABO68439.1 Teichoic acid biosynthesis proteins [Geobacillus thermodenitrificans NG80-2]ARA98445.1 glycosyltransferase [Geobacillus thermodenitrificans]ATO37811.1 glycosyltransferase [Geobacillus thermodenitrificans]KQB91784.1 acetylmannosaminyltransferase [Geobacillus sp. PA-3]MED3904383.1 WecB/TagA/CpsF family glycosyltransferase [Geobacillus thermodenitrificans]